MRVFPCARLAAIATGLLAGIGGQATMKGEDLQQLVKQVSDLSPTMLEKVRHAYTANRRQ